MTNKHTPYDLKQMQSLPLAAKIIMTQQRIRQWYEYWDGMVYVSFSGGKDSTVLKHIVDNMYDDVPALFVNTGLEYPEIQQFAMSQKNVVTVRPEMRFDEVLKVYGYPTVSKGVAHAVGIAKRNPNGNVMKKKWLQNGCNAFDGENPSSQPMSFWTEQDVLHYIKKYDVPYCSVYGEIVPTSEEEQVAGQLTTFDILDDYSGTLLTTTGCNRTGCIFCMFGCHLEKEPNRFQRLKETHPRQYEYCIGGGEYVDGKWQPSKEGLGLGKVLDYIGVKY